MSSTKYTYSISGDFPNNKVDDDRLAQEIRTSSIPVALDFIQTAGDECNIWFKAALSSGEETTLDGLVASHSGEPLPLPDEPKADDGKLFVAPNIFPLGSLTNFCGVADDVAQGLVGQGDLLTIASVSQGDTEKIIQFIEQSFLAGGFIQYDGGIIGDWVSFAVVVPGTVGTSNPGAGMWNKVPIGGGINVFVPAAGNGNWDLNLSEKENANVSFSKVRPVPAPSGGFIDWNEDTEAITLNASQKGGFNLFDADMTINEFITKVPLLGSGQFVMTVPAVKPIKMLAHWKYKITLHNSTEKSLKIAAMMYRAKWNAL